jgi:hypothetical protein
MITFDYNKSYRKGKLICDESMLTFIRNHFSEKDPNASFAQMKLRLKGVNRNIPDRSYAIQSSGMFDFGLYNEILKFLMTESISDIHYTDEFKQEMHCGIKNFTVWDELAHKLRDYQTDCLWSCISVGRGTVVSATGSGKSLIQASLIGSV